jgi:hypothetical protein
MAAFSHTNKRGVTYFLHSKKTTLKNGKVQVIFYFAKEKKAGVLEALPAGYKVVETPNGLPVLKKT